MIDLMVDLETLDTKLTSTVLTLGAVKFDPFSNDPMQELYLKIDIDSQDALGCTISDSTLEWWGKQDPAIMEEAFDPSGRIPIADAMAQFHKFAWGCNHFWSNGSCFDLMILENLYAALQKTVPWQYWEIRDTRTLYALADPKMPQAQKHNALEDAKRQAIGVRNVYKALGIVGSIIKK